jgi:hypothetical protein
MNRIGIFFCNSETKQLGKNNSASLNPPISAPTCSNRITGPNIAQHKTKSASHASAHVILIQEPAYEVAPANNTAVKKETCPGSHLVPTLAADTRIFTCSTTSIHCAHAHSWRASSQKNFSIRIKQTMCTPTLSITTSLSASRCPRRSCATCSPSGVGCVDTSSIVSVFSRQDTHS